LSSKEQRAIYSAKYRAANFEKIKASKAKYHAANPEKAKASKAKYHAANPEKAKASKAKYRAANFEKIKANKAKYNAANFEKVKASKAKGLKANPSISIINKISRTYKTPAPVLRQLIPQELIDVKILQITLHRLIKEKGLNNVPARLR
jgi:hypothetical protein